jgi:hypothetical protein
MFDLRFKIYKGRAREGERLSPACRQAGFCVCNSNFEIGAFEFV